MVQHFYFEGSKKQTIVVTDNFTVKTKVLPGARSFLIKDPWKGFILLIPLLFIKEIQMTSFIGTFISFCVLGLNHLLFQRSKFS